MMMRMVRYSIIGFFVLFAPVSLALAHIPVLVEQPTLKDETVIQDPVVSHAYYAELTGLPHQYIFEVAEPMTLYVQVLVPDIEGSMNNVSGLIMKAVPGSVLPNEIARLPAKEASWKTFYEPFGGDNYREGNEFVGEVEPGSYKIEVGTPDNLAKYVLVVGKKEDFSEVGFFETIRRIAGVKVFFGKSQFRVVESPFVYVPLILVFIITGSVWFFARRRKPTPQAPEEML